MAQVVLKCSSNQGGGSGSGSTDLPNDYQIDENGDFYKDSTLFLFRDFGESLNSLGNEYKRVEVLTPNYIESAQRASGVGKALHLRVFDKFYPAWAEVYRSNNPDKYSEDVWNKADAMIARLVSKNPNSYTAPNGGSVMTFGTWAVVSGGVSTVTDWFNISQAAGAVDFAGDTLMTAPYNLLPFEVGFQMKSPDAEYNNFATGVCWGIDRTTNWKARANMDASSPTGG